MAEKKKKEKKDVNLPSISRSIRRSRDLAQGKANYNDGFKAVGIVLAILVIAFVLLGGINQAAFVRTMVDFAKNIGDKFVSWVDKGNVEVTDSGIYITPAGPDGGLITGNHGDDTTSDSTTSEWNNTSDDTSNATSDSDISYQEVSNSSSDSNDDTSTSIPFQQVPD